MTAVITLTSCNSDEYDGDWDDMIWKTEVKATEQDGTYLVAATTFTGIVFKNSSISSLSIINITPNIYYYTIIIS